MRYVATIDSSQTPLSIDSIDELRRLLSQASETNCDLTLYQELGERTGIEKLFCRVLGLSNVIEGCSISLLSNSQIAFLTFSDENDDEFVAQPANVIEPTAIKVSFILNTGETFIASPSQCVEIPQAIKEVEHFYAHGKRSSDLSWAKS